MRPKQRLENFYCYKRVKGYFFSVPVSTLKWYRLIIGDTVARVKRLLFI